MRLAICLGFIILAAAIASGCVKNTIDGADRTPGEDTVVEIIDPCGPEGQFDEVILRMGDGRLIAYFEQGRNRFLIELKDGSYTTTDGTSCQFQIAEGEVTWH